MTSNGRFSCFSKMCYFGLRFFGIEKECRKSTKKSQKRCYPLTILEFSGDHFGNGMTSNGRLSCFSKMSYFGLRIFGIKKKCRKSTKKSQKRCYPSKILEFSGDHFGNGVTSNGRLSCFSKMSRIQLTGFPKSPNKPSPPIRF